MKRTMLIGIALLIASVSGGCTPERAMDFGSVSESVPPPADELSARILKDFDGRNFILGPNDREAEVRLAEWPAGHHVLLPFWLGVNPVFPNFLRPVVGHLYVISEAVLVRPLDDQGSFLIRAGSKMFKADTVFEPTHTRYVKPGKMLPTVVRFVGTRIITVPQDPPATGTVTEKVTVLREVSLPMGTAKTPEEYAPFEIRTISGAQKG